MIDLIFRRLLFGPGQCLDQIRCDIFILHFGISSLLQSTTKYEHKANENDTIGIDEKYYRLRRWPLSRDNLIGSFPVVLRWFNLCVIVEAEFLNTLKQLNIFSDGKSYDKRTSSLGDRNTYSRKNIPTKAEKASATIDGLTWKNYFD